MKRISKVGCVGYSQYEYANPEALPWADEDDPEYSFPQWDERLDEVEAEVFGGGSDETVVGRLAEDWNGHPAGSLILSGLTVEGHPFAIIESL